MCGADASSAAFEVDLVFEFDLDLSFQKEGLQLLHWTIAGVTDPRQANSSPAQHPWRDPASQPEHAPALP